MRSEELNQIYLEFKADVEILFDAARKYFLVLCVTFKILPEHRDDVTQEALLKLWKVLKKYDPRRASFSTYCSQVFRSSFLNWIAKENLHRRRYTSLTPLLAEEVV